MDNNLDAQVLSNRPKSEEDVAREQYEETIGHTCFHCRNFIIAPCRGQFAEDVHSKHTVDCIGVAAVTMRYEEFEAASRGDCGMFSGITLEGDSPRNLRDLSPEDLDLNEPFTFQIHFTPGRDDDLDEWRQVLCSFHDGSRTITWSTIIQRWQICSARNNHAAKRFKLRPPNPYVASPSTFKVAHQWFNECLSSHDSCKRAISVDQPTRLICLTPAERNKRPCLQPTEKHRSYQYAALSYCWGGDQLYKTTGSNLERYMYELPVEELPQTITDALRVVKELGLCYIWIDALCIVQDDPDDMIKELAKMPSVYQGACVTICASVANSVTKGFLHNRQPETLWQETDFRVRYRCDDGTLGSVIMMHPTDSHRDINSNPEPAHRRAWVLQEMVLSSRVLDYGSRCLQWICPTITRVDGGRESALQGNAFGHIPATLRPLGTSEHAPFLWTTLMSFYSERQLTFTQDKLVAVAAIAEEYENNRDTAGEVYLAGLWKLSLPGQLLWKVSVKDGSLDPLSRPTTYRAPSWSWAAIDSPISWSMSDRFTQVTSELVEWAVVPCDSCVPHGAVKSACLTIHGITWETEWNYRQNEGDGPLPDWDAENTGLDVHFSADATESELLDRLTVTCLEIRGDNSASAGLVLLPCNNSTFRRIGCYWTEMRWNWPEYDVDLKEVRREWLVGSQSATVTLV